VRQPHHSASVHQQPGQPTGARPRVSAASWPEVYHWHAKQGRLGLNRFCRANRQTPHISSLIGMHSSLSNPKDPHQRVTRQHVYCRLRAPEQLSWGSSGILPWARWNAVANDCHEEAICSQTQELKTALKARPRNRLYMCIRFSMLIQ